MIAAALDAWAGLGRPVERLGDSAHLVAEVTDSAGGVPDPTAWLDALARQAADVRGDDARFRAALAGAEGEARAVAFADLRKTYPVRREMDRYTVRGPVPEALRTAVSEGLGMRLSPASGL